MNNNCQIDSNDWLGSITEQYNQVREINDSIAEHRAEYRKFSNLIGINDKALLKCCKCFEWSLLINCYTFAEQLSKNLFYTLIGKDAHCNQYVNNFINNKVPNGKFSPNVQIDGLEKLVKELDDKFKFILPKKIKEFTIYDEMVKARHTYAHRGTYMFDSSNFSDVINVLYYIKFELMVVEKYSNKRLDFQNNIKDILDLTQSINKKRKHRCAPNEIHELLKSIKLKCKELKKRYQDILDNSDGTLLNTFFQILYNISVMDLRKDANCLSFIDQLDAYVC